VKKSVPASTAMCAEMNSFQLVLWLCFGAVRYLPFQNVSDRLVGDMVAEIGQCPGNPIVLPAGILPGHADDEGFSSSVDAGASRVWTMPGSVELASNQTTIPGEDGVWSGDTCNLSQKLTAESFADLGERGPLWIGQSEPSGDMRAVAKLEGADLCRADLSEANLGGADLRNAYLVETIFVNTDLSETKEMERCYHRGPCSIGIDTFFKSKGGIPESFLRGCGVPEQFITYARSLVSHPIEFYSCFITYSSKDQEFAAWLHADLRAKNLRCWFAPEDLKIGDRFQERIEESIRLFDKSMIVLSEASVQSRWVERKVNAAREREDRENRTVLFPIRIDDACTTQKFDQRVK
jgi:hypothetical protein